MTKSSITAAFLLAVAVSATSSTANSQDAVLAEMYGRGVHAFYSGDQNGAYDLLSMAIDSGSKDPRAYYFRGLVANNMGRQFEGEADWQKGAELEANGGASPAIGQSLTRFQGSSRLKLEQFRQTARLQAMAGAATRSKARYGEIEAAESAVLRGAPKPPAAAAAAAAPVTPPVPPAAADDNPFADDMATGQPKVESADVLDGAMDNPFADNAAAPAGGAAAGGANPFGGAADAGADPFGGGAPAADADPFGGGAPAADAGADPFGGGGDAGGEPMADPFGGDPFGN